MKIALIGVIALIVAVYGNNSSSSSVEDNGGEEAGDEKKQEAFIVGGSFAGENEFPFLVTMSPVKGPYCGAILLTDRWVLTAAHCNEHGAKYVGTTPNGKFGHDKVRWYEIEKIYESPDLKYRRDIKKKNYKGRADIALIKTKHRIEMVPGKIEPICIKDEPILHLDDRDNINVTAIGWGSIVHLKHEPTYNKGIKKVVLRAMKCWHGRADKQKGGKAKGYRWVDDDGICLQEIKKNENDVWTGLGPSHGDSGSPALYRAPDGSWKVMGVASWTNKILSSYTRVWGYLPWMEQIMGRKIC